MKALAYFALVILTLVAIFAVTIQGDGEFDRPSALSKLGLTRFKRGVVASYFYSSVARNWNDANRDCKENHNGQLVAITSKTINDKVEDIIDTNGLGPTILWTDGRFEYGPSTATRRWLWWTTKAPLTSYTYRPLGVIDPSTLNANATSCMATSRNGASFTWIHTYCTSSLRYICVNQD